MIKGYLGDELWQAINPLTGKWEHVDPEGEFIPGEVIVKLFYCKRLDGYVTIPGSERGGQREEGVKSFVASCWHLLEPSLTCFPPMKYSLSDSLRCHNAGLSTKGLTSFLTPFSFCLSWLTLMRSA